LALNLPMGRLADTAGRRILMVSGMVLCAVADVGTGLAPTLPLLVFARLLLGAGLSSSDAGASAWVADATEDRADKRASFLGVQNAVIASAFVIGPAIGGRLVDAFGMSSIFFAVSVGAAICAAGYATLPELRQELPEEKRNQSATESLQELLASPEQQALAGVSVAFYCGAACKISLVPSIMSEVFAATSSEVGQLFSAIAAIGILGTLLGGRLTDAVGPRNVLFACGTVCAAAYCGAAVAVQAHARESFFACLAVWSLAASVKSPALQAFAIAAAPEDRRGTALSVPKTVGDMSYLLAPFVLGVVDDVLGPAAALACCAATFLAGTVVFAARANNAR
jgi:MFS family permease